MGDRINACGILVGNPNGRDHLGELGVDGTTILRWIVDRV